MCLHSNIWGLIINIRNTFLKKKKQENKHAGRIMDYQRNWILPEKYNSKEKKYLNGELPLILLFSDICTSIVIIN